MASGESRMSVPLRIVIADDEPDARDKLRRLLTVHRDVSIVGEATTGVEVVRTVRALHPHVVFLDIRMPELDGLTAAGAVGATDAAPKVVFVTAYDTHAIKAFEVQALDYVLKPYDGERLARALDRIRQQLKIEGVADQDDARLLVRSDGKVRAVYLREIEWVESYGNYVCFHTPAGRILKRGTIKALLDRLDAARFARIHRRAIVNLDCVRTVVPAMAGDQWLRVASGTRLRVSRAHRAEFLARWRQRCRTK
jgi:two-component system, LytTR family, response regulator